jgi:hypothetical protein
MTGTTLYAVTTGNTLLPIDLDTSGVRIVRNRANRTGRDARCIFTLSAEMCYLNAGERHEYPDTRCFRPNPSFMFQAAGYLTSTATTALSMIPHDPKRLGDRQVIPLTFNQQYLRKAKREW